MGEGREKKKSDETRKMKTVREIAGKPGRMCDERREGGRGRRGGGGGGYEKEVISGLFLPAFLSAPLLKYSEEKHIQGGAFLICQRTQCKMGAHV